MRLVLLALLGMTAVARAEDPVVAPPVAPAVPAPQAAPTPWLQKDSAQLQVLDKVNSRASVLTVKVGESVTFGSLTIAVKACAIRPPDMPADATAFLTITDSNPKGVGFTGWMLKATPAVSMLAHPIYDVRVVGCL